MQIHWFSIINSCVTVLLLTGFLATILMRVLKNDFVKYTRDDDGAPSTPDLPVVSRGHAGRQPGRQLACLASPVPMPAIDPARVWIMQHPLQMRSVI